MRPFWGRVALCVALTVGPVAASAATQPLKPHGQLVEEVMAFLLSDVGENGILTLDGDPEGEPVPPYFYHYAIQHTNNLRSSTSGYPGYASISYPGYTMSVAIDAFLAYWAYSGAPEALARARACADWLIPRRTLSGDLYANWVYSTQTDAVMGGGFDGDAIMSDKPAMFGRRCLTLFEITGDVSYLDAATEIADTYVATQRSGGIEDEGRWPFRVRPSDGLVRQDYTSHLVPAIRLLEAMEDRSPGHGYGAAAARAWAWLDANPLDPSSPNFMHWEGFYEDIAPEDCVGLMDHYSAENTLAALLERGLPGDVDDAIAILDWSTNRYLAPDNAQNGWGVYAPALLEWDAWLNTTYAATGQWAVANLLLDEATRGTPQHDPTWRPRAIEALHTLTYGQVTVAPAADGRMLTTIRELSHPTFLNETWYEQNFNTVIYMLRGMGLAPELAPAGENHLLRAVGGTLTSIDYGAVRIATSWSAPGRALFKLADRPFAVRIGSTWYPAPSTSLEGSSWTWDGATQTCWIQHEGEETEIAVGGTVAAPPPAANAGVNPPARLLQPYPNPFNPRVVIPFRVDAPAAVRLSIHDARGRRVVTLHDRWTNAGEYRVAWSGADEGGRPMPSGVYSVLLVTGASRQVGRLVLLR
jgi:hypothetical protein